MSNMLHWLKIHLIFLVISLLIAFALIPADQFYFSNIHAQEIKDYYYDEMAFEKTKAWKIVFTWFLGLTGGRLMIRALNK